VNNNLSVKLNLKTKIPVGESNTTAMLWQHRQTTETQLPIHQSSFKSTN